MKKLLTIFLVIFSFLLNISAGDIVRVSAEYEYASSNPDETPAQAEANAFERAKLKALEDRFGLDVSQITNTLIVNSSGSTNSSNTFSSGQTAVRGEWIETTEQKVLDKQFTNGFWIIRVRVEGKARNYSTEKADIRYAFVRDTRDMEPPVSFRDGNDLFLRFATPVAGHLCVYLVDEQQNAFCLLPYAANQSGSQTVEANRDYIFFSTLQDPHAQEYTVNCERSAEQNMLLVIFSPNDFTKAADREGGRNFRDEQLPRQLSYASLMKWLARNQTKDDAMLVRSTIISIRK